LLTLELPKKGVFAAVEADLSEQTAMLNWMEGLDT